jgi:hypothetical protein
MYLQRCIATGLLAAVVAGSPAAFAAYPVATNFLVYPGYVLFAHQEALPGASAAPVRPAALADGAAPPADATTGAAEAGSFGEAAPAQTLDAIRGGDGSIASDTRLDGTVSGNSATHVITGANIIQSGSFANANGVPIVIQNSGANVLIQNATVINLQVK